MLIHYQIEDMKISFYSFSVASSICCFFCCAKDFFFFSSTSLLLPTHLPPPLCTRAQSCNPMDFSPPDSSIHGFFQARILEWVAISFSIVVQKIFDTFFFLLLIGTVNDFFG